ncbi:hypothetical protein D3C86_1777100 [compost metagenome]
MQPGEGLRQAVVQVVGHAFAFVFLCLEQPMHQIGHGAFTRNQGIQQPLVFQVRGQQGGEQLQGFDVLSVRRTDADTIGQHQRTEGRAIAAAQRHP